MGLGCQEGILTVGKYGISSGFGESDSVRVPVGVCPVIVPIYPVFSTEGLFRIPVLYRSRLDLHQASR